MRRVKTYGQDVFGECGIEHREVINVSQPLSWYQPWLVGVLQPLCQLELDWVQEVSVVFLHKHDCSLVADNVRFCLRLSGLTWCL